MKIDSPVASGWIQLTMTSTVLMMILIFSDALPPQRSAEFDAAELLGLTFCLLNIIAQWQMFTVVRRLQAGARALEGGDDVATR